jgi:hypothetical protein
LKFVAAESRKYTVALVLTRFVSVARRAKNREDSTKPLTRLPGTRSSRRKKAHFEIQNPKSEMDRASSRRLLQLKDLIHQVRGDLDWVVMNEHGWALNAFWLPGDREEGVR